MSGLLDIRLEAKSALPIYDQIKRAIKQAIFSARLKGGEQLTSIRELALQLRINPNTIIKAYYQLEVEGFVQSRPGAGYFVKVDRKKIQKERREIFRGLTDEYVSRALDLGYSFKDILEEIARKENGTFDTKGESQDDQR